MPTDYEDLLSTLAIGDWYLSGLNAESSNVDSISLSKVIKITDSFIHLVVIHRASEDFMTTSCSEYTISGKSIDEVDLSINKFKISNNDINLFNGAMFIKPEVLTLFETLALKESIKEVFNG